MPTLTAQIGAKGEREATKWLRGNGFLIHALNWRSGHYELDIVAERWGVLHFVEVKTRRAEGFTTPQEAMTKQKCDSMVKAARLYIAQHNIRQEMQFDLLAVEMGEDGSMTLRHIEHVIEFRW
ncbi:MAG: YraN family protein [Rikenellaceae bacterium]